jgi:hypothetical protein
MYDKPGTSHYVRYRNEGKTFQRHNSRGDSNWMRQERKQMNAANRAAMALEIKAAVADYQHDV